MKFTTTALLLAVMLSLAFCHGDENGHNGHGDENGHNGHGDENGHNGHGDENGHNDPPFPPPNNGTYPPPPPPNNGTNPPPPPPNNNTNPNNGTIPSPPPNNNTNSSNNTCRAISVPVGVPFNFTGKTDDYLNTPCLDFQFTSVFALQTHELPYYVSAVVNPSQLYNYFYVQVVRGPDCVNAECVAKAIHTLQFEAGAFQWYWLYVSNEMGIPLPFGLTINFLPPHCGNGVVELSEQCDGGLGCGDDCMCKDHYSPFYPVTVDCYQVYVPMCGNEVVDVDVGEECDSGDGCNANCTCMWGYREASPPSTACEQRSVACSGGVVVYDESLSETNYITKANTLEVGCWEGTNGRMYTIRPSEEGVMEVAACSEYPIFLTVYKCNEEDKYECMEWGWEDDWGDAWCTDMAYAVHTRFMANGYDAYKILVSTNEILYGWVPIVEFSVVVFPQEYEDFISTMAIVITVMVILLVCCFCCCCMGLCALHCRNQSRASLISVALKQDPPKSVPVTSITPMTIPMSVVTPTQPQPSAPQDPSSLHQEKTPQPQPQPQTMQVPVNVPGTYNSQPMPYAFVYPMCLPHNQQPLYPNVPQ